MVLSWNLQNMLETPFPSFISKKPGEFRYLELFLAKIQFCPIFPWKSAFSGPPCLKTSLWRHTLADFQNFGINGKGRPPILWYHTLILWACQSQVHEGGGNPPLGRCVTENTLGRRGLRNATRIHHTKLDDQFSKTTELWYENQHVICCFLGIKINYHEQIKTNNM